MYWPLNTLHKSNHKSDLITRKTQHAWFYCAALVCPFTGATTKVGLALRSKAGFPCQNVLVSMFSALSKGLFLSYLLSAWDNSSKGGQMWCVCHMFYCFLLWVLSKHWACLVASVYTVINAEDLVVSLECYLGALAFRSQVRSNHWKHLREKAKEL